MSQKNLEKKSKVDIYKYIGLAKRAGRAFAGIDAIKQHLGKSCNTYLLVVSPDQSNTRDKIINMVKDRVKIVTAESSEKLANSVGKNRVAGILVCSKEIAGTILKLSEEGK